MPGRASRRDRIDPLRDYAEAMSGPIPNYLEEVERQTYLKTVAPQMMCGRLQGRLLALLSKLQQPTRILEIGTFTGYATLCLAEGLGEEGTVDTIEGDAEVAFWARRNFAASPFADRINLHLGQAKEVLNRLAGPYDIIFLDGDKRAYPDYLPLLLSRLRVGGLLLADNVLWDGRVGGKTRDDDAAALQSYNKLVYQNDRLENLILPLRDGLSVAWLGE
ncbi:O-methyltransferase [Neolewinella sp.]|uniref:O-methyltransferase n=1 Tax=Neolewinella sp. TaxID=2993543 RepID=UPI003B518FBE